jgi:hypothetical protein
MFSGINDKKEIKKTDTGVSKKAPVLLIEI